MIDCAKDDIMGNLKRQKLIEIDQTIPEHQDQLGNQKTEEKFNQSYMQNYNKYFGQNKSQVNIQIEEKPTIN